MSGTTVSSVIGRTAPGMEKLLQSCDNCSNNDECSPEHRLAVNFNCEKWLERLPASADQNQDKDILQQ